MKITEKKFLDAGFSSTVDDYEFHFEKQLVSQEVIDENELEGDDIPKLLFGDTGLNRGFCIWTGAHFVFFNAETPADAVQFASKITAFEPA